MIRLTGRDLAPAPLEALERLARALGVQVRRHECDTEGEYRRRLTHAIQRAEKRLAASG